MIGRAIAALMIVGATSVAAAADPGERAEVLLSSGAINRFIAKQLPSTFPVSGDRDAGIGAQDITLVDARYCGAGDKAGRGRFLAVVRLAEAGGAAPPGLEDRDCRAKLDDLARRLAGGPGVGAVSAVELIAVWSPSWLRLSIADTATRGEGSRLLERTMARAKDGPPLGIIELSGIALKTERGSSLGFDVAFSFLKVGEGLLLTLTPSCPGCTPAGPRAPSVVQGALPPDSDGAVGATLSLANRVVALYSADGPLVLEMDRQTVEIRNAQISGGDGALAVRGQATAREVGESALVRIESSGADLRLTDVHADPELEDCSAQSGAASFRCNIRNRARGPAAAALAAAMSSRYRGKLLRTLILAPPFSFDVGSRRLTLRLTPTRASATGGAVVVHGKVDFE
jgi:hypothetical protein